MFRKWQITEIRSFAGLGAFQMVVVLRVTDPCTGFAGEPRAISLQFHKSILRLVAVAEGFNSDSTDGSQASFAFHCMYLFRSKCSTPSIPKWEKDRRKMKHEIGFDENENM